MTGSPSSSIGSSPPPLDRSSLSNPQDVLVTHLDWEATVDFDNNILLGSATYTLKFFNESATQLFLDTSDLDIRSVLVEDGEVSSTFELECPPHPHLGQRLKIDLPKGAKQTKKVTIEYATTDKCSALQWLPPSQTAGKKYPYLFTQCQAIHARSLIPCQDQPGVKTTYNAKVQVPTWATCVMSALHKNDEEDNESKMKTFVWEQPVPVSSYLLAMAVGELECVDISDRVRIWSEPSIVQAAAYEFAETEAFVKVGEDITKHAYPWTRYDLLCLPPSFPYGGMENPCLTFVTPTLLAKDRSLANVVAHEIAHSWTGNLITNATWEHFWLNEGWTVWLERKITTRMINEPLYYDFDSIGGWKDLKESVDLMPTEFTSLKPILGEQDPDDAFSSIPYEKGFNLLYALEKRVGCDAFEIFFQKYIDTFQYKTVTSEQFRDFFISEFPDVKDVDWETWLYAPGMPPETPNFDRTLAEKSEQLAKDWLVVDRDSNNSTKPPEVELKSWSTPQILCFLDTLQTLTEDQPLKVETLSLINEQYKMAQSHNSEILFRYCMLAVTGGDESILPVAIHFITTQGRMKFVRPLYRALYQSNMGKTIVVETFLKHKDFYHPICSKMIATDFKSDNNKAVENDDDDNKKGSKILSVLRNNQVVAVTTTAVAAIAIAVGLILIRKRK